MPVMLYGSSLTTMICRKAMLLYYQHLQQATDHQHVWPTHCIYTASTWFNSLSLTCLLTPSLSFLLSLHTFSHLPPLPYHSQTTKAVEVLLCRHYSFLHRGYYKDASGTAAVHFIYASLTACVVAYCNIETTRTQMSPQAFLEWCMYITSIWCQMVHKLRSQRMPPAGTNRT